MGRKISGAQRFEETYNVLYGSRWEMLKQALLEPPNQIAYETALLRPYYLDQASLEPPLLLDVRPGMDVLDLCAAPGGKSLVLAVCLAGEGSLHLNDMSADRIRRLKQVIRDHLPETLSSIIRVTRSDGSRLGMSIKEAYDRILLDAPCSSERHVINSPPHLEEWSPGRIKSLAIRQFALAASALDMLKSGGVMVYSTCSLHPEENDGIIAKMKKKRAGLFEVLDSKSPLAEDTEFGSIILPDVSSGRGPIYFSVIRKL